MAGDRTDALSADADAAPAATGPSSALLCGSALLSAGLMLLPLFALVWFWPGVPHGSTCDPAVQPWCRPGYGLPQWYAVAAACVTSCGFHVAAVLRRPRPGAGRRSAFGLLFAASTLLLVTLVPAVLSGVVPEGWFFS